MWVFVLTAGIVRIVWRKFLDWSALNTAEEIQAIEERKRNGEEEPQFECTVNGEKAPDTEVPNVGVYLQVPLSKSEELQAGFHLSWDAALS